MFNHKTAILDIFKVMPIKTNDPVFVLTYFKGLAIFFSWYSQDINSSGHVTLQIFNVNYDIIIIIIIIISIIGDG